MSISISMRPWGEIHYTPEGIKAYSAWGVFQVRPDVLARALRLDRKHPNNYDEGYLAAWCKYQGTKQ